jgi:hypothetical protein
MTYPNDRTPDERRRPSPPDDERFVPVGRPPTGPLPPGVPIPRPPGDLPPPPPLAHVAAVAGGAVFGRYVTLGQPTPPDHDPAAPGGPDGPPTAYRGAAPVGAPLPPGVATPVPPPPAALAGPTPPLGTPVLPPPPPLVGAVAAPPPAAALAAPPAGPAVAAPPPGAATTAPPAAERVAAAAAEAAALRTSARGAPRGGVAVPDALAHQPPGRDGVTPPPGPEIDTGTAGPDRLRVGSHRAVGGALRHLRIGLTGGLVLGADRQQAPVTVRLFRPQPTRTTLVGRPDTGQLLAFRALGLGARVLVVSSDPTAWQPFAETAARHGDPAAVLAPDQPWSLAGTAARPVLVVHDLDTVSPGAMAPPGPWQAHVTILRHLVATGVAALQASDLVILQRLSPEAASLASRALHLPGSSTQFLQVMADSMVALVTHGTERYVWLSHTEIERRYVSTPRRR